MKTVDLLYEEFVDSSNPEEMLSKLKKADLIELLKYAHEDCSKMIDYYKLEEEFGEQIYNKRLEELGFPYNKYYYGVTSHYERISPTVTSFQFVLTLSNLIKDYKARTYLLNIDIDYRNSFFIINDSVDMKITSFIERCRGNMI